MWVFYSFLTSFLESGKDVVGKKAAHKTDEYISAFAFDLIGFIILLPLVLISGIPKLTSSFWIAVVASFFIRPISVIFYMKALKFSPLSVAVPMIAFNPVFIAVLSYFFDGQLPSMSGWLGILLIALGLYVHRFDRNVLKKGIFYPFVRLKDEKGAQYMLIVAFIWSVGVHTAKMRVVGSSPVFSTIAGTVVGIITSYLIMRWKSRVDRKAIYASWKYLCSLGLLGTLSNLSMNKALSIGYTPFVAPIKRTSIIWSSVMGKLVFRERISIGKIIGTLLMFVGLLFIILF